MSSCTDFEYRGTIVLNNMATQLLHGGAYRQADEIFRSAVQLARRASLREVHGQDLPTDDIAHKIQRASQHLNARTSVAADGVVEMLTYDTSLTMSMALEFDRRSRNCYVFKIEAEDRIDLDVLSSIVVFNLGVCQFCRSMEGVDDDRVKHAANALKLVELSNVILAAGFDDTNYQELFVSILVLCTYVRLLFANGRRSDGKDALAKLSDLRNAARAAEELVRPQHDAAAAA